jgi:hypothetical protein
MNVPTAIGAMLQIIAAVLIFVASYLALVLCTIACLAIAELISERTSVVRQYGANPVPAGPHGLSEIGREAPRSGLTFRQQILKRIS